jgi:type III secretion protein C
MMKLLLPLLSLLLLHSAVWAQSSVQFVPWRTPRVTIHAQERDLADLLKEFATSQNLPIAISDQVKGSVSGVFSDVETGRFLDAISESNSLVWFYDGTKLHIEPADAVVSRVMAFTHLTKKKLEDTLYTIGYASGPKGREVMVKTGARPGLLVLVGGPQFIRATEALANDLEAQETTDFAERMEVRSFRLKYASASDMTVEAGQQTTVLPGVARTLTNLMLEEGTEGGGRSMATGPLQTTRGNQHSTLKGMGLAAVGGNPMIDQEYVPYPVAAQPAPPRRQKEELPGGPTSPMISVDTRLNAVLVRDYAARIPLYEELIRMLDVPTNTIEITASIVDIDESVGFDFGTELLGFGKKNANLYRLGFNADRGLFDPVDTQGQTPSFTEGPNLARGVGLNATALFTGMGYEFLTRLKALEEDGKAQLVTSPSVLTMDNIQAVIRTDETVYVRVAGNMETDLYDVSTGVVFRVTPSFVDEGAKKSFRLSVEITDGSFLPNQSVDQIPGTRESAITTQAIVPNANTLLLGGYFVERKEKQFSGVPLLSKIPVVKNVLSLQQRSHSRAQRFFFITPRLVNPGIEATPVPLDSPQISRMKEELNDSFLTNQVDGVEGHALGRKIATEGIRQRFPIYDPSQKPPAPVPAPTPLLPPAPAETVIERVEMASPIMPPPPVEGRSTLQIKVDNEGTETGVKIKDHEAPKPKAKPQVEVKSPPPTEIKAETQVEAEPKPEGKTKFRKWLNNLIHTIRE